MNLIKDLWLPVIRNDGSREKIAIWQMLDNYKTNPIIDIESPRPDFRNAIYQLLIGIVQVAAMPEDDDEWHKLWDKPYSEKDFKSKILEYEDCFEIDSDGPAFMQDYSPKEFTDVEPKNIGKLILGSPGENTIKLNKDHFVKRDENCAIDIYWSAIALFGLQTFGPPDGGGHREGLRGSGPLTCLIVPYKSGKQTALWNSIWSNVFPNEEISSWNGNKKSEIFPWMKPTKVSTGNIITLYKDYHPLSVYWSFPRRIRLRLNTRSEGFCSLSNTKSNCLISNYATLKHGTLYSNLWEHPFTPYYKERPKEESNKKNTIRAFSNNFIYRNWVSLILGNGKVLPAKNVIYNNKRIKDFAQYGVITSLWISGFDMVPGEATVNNWYETMMPIYSLDQKETKELEIILGKFLSFASEVSGAVIYRIKESWFRRPKDVSGDLSHISISFWQNTEKDFYRILSRLVENVSDNSNLSKCAADWLTIIRKQSFGLFDKWALSGQEEGMDMKKVIKARNELGKTIYITSKELRNMASLKEGE
jgi:CRISPR system Cascade subunit CasA